LGQDVLVAANAYVIATESGDQARHRWKSVIARRNSETIDFFRKVIGRSGAAAWASLGEEQMVDSNAGVELGLIGSFEEIRQRIPKLQALRPQSHRLPVRRPDAGRRTIHEKRHSAAP
jgi:hypothetical protein